MKVIFIFLPSDFLDQSLKPLKGHDLSVSNLNKIVQSS